MGNELIVSFLNDVLLPYPKKGLTRDHLLKIDRGSAPMILWLLTVQIMTYMLRILHVPSLLEARSGARRN